MRFTSDDLGGIDLKLGHRALGYLVRCEPPFRPDVPFRVILSRFRREVGIDFYEIEAAFVKAKLMRKTRKQDAVLPAQPTCSRSCYFLTTKARQIAKGNTMKRMPRGHLEKLLVKARAKVEEVRVDDRFVYEFAFLAVIGSYLDRDKADYGDLDLAFWLQRKPAFAEWTERELADYHFDCWPGDTRFWTPAQLVVWSRPRRHVQSASYQRIDMVTYDDFIHLTNNDEPYQVLIGDVSATCRAWLEAERSGKMDLIINYG